MSTLNISLDTALYLQTRWPMVSRGGGILWRPPSRTACYLCHGGYVFVLVCLLVRLFVNRIIQKHVNEFHEIIESGTGPGIRNDRLHFERSVSRNVTF